MTLSDSCNIIIAEDTSKNRYSSTRVLKYSSTLVIHYYEYSIIVRSELQHSSTHVLEYHQTIYIYEMLTFSCAHYVCLFYHKLISH